MSRSTNGFLIITIRSDPHWRDQSLESCTEVVRVKGIVITRPSNSTNSKSAAREIPKYKPVVPPIFDKIVWGWKWKKCVIIVMSYMYEHHAVWNDQLLNRFFNSLFGQRKRSALLALCEGYSPVGSPRKGVAMRKWRHQQQNTYSLCKTVVLQLPWIAMDNAMLLLLLVSFMRNVIRYWYWQCPSSWNIFHGRFSPFPYFSIIHNNILLSMCCFYHETNASCVPCELTVYVLNSLMCI